MFKCTHVVVDDPAVIEAEMEVGGELFVADGRPGLAKTLRRRSDGRSNGQESNDDEDGDFGVVHFSYLFEVTEFI